MSTFKNAVTIPRLLAIGAMATLASLAAPDAHAATISAGSTDHTFTYFIDKPPMPSRSWTPQGPVLWPSLTAGWEPATIPLTPPVWVWTAR